MDRPGLLDRRHGRPAQLPAALRPSAGVRWPGWDPLDGRTAGSDPLEEVVRRVGADDPGRHLHPDGRLHRGDREDDGRSAANGRSSCPCRTPPGWPRPCRPTCSAGPTAGRWWPPAARSSRSPTTRSPTSSARPTTPSSSRASVWAPSSPGPSRVTDRMIFAAAGRWPAWSTPPPPAPPCSPRSTTCGRRRWPWPWRWRRPPPRTGCARAPLEPDLEAQVRRCMWEPAYRPVRPA